MGFKEIKASGVNEFGTIISLKLEYFSFKLGFHHMVKLNKSKGNLIFVVQQLSPGASAKVIN